MPKPLPDYRLVNETTSEPTNLSNEHSGDDVAPGTPIDPAWGTAGLVLGALIFGLDLLDSTSALPFDLPPSWYTDRALWYLIALASIAAGCYVLKGGRHDSRWQHDRAGRPVFERVVLYSRRGCHLCEDAKAVLARYQYVLPEVREVDIEGDPQLKERFGHCIPVVEIDGKVRFRGYVNEILLRRLIDARSSCEP